MATVPLALDRQAQVFATNLRTLAVDLGARRDEMEAAMASATTLPADAVAEYWHIVWKTHRHVTLAERWLTHCDVEEVRWAYLQLRCVLHDAQTTGRTWNRHVSEQRALRTPGLTGHR